MRIPGEIPKIAEVYGAQKKIGRIGKAGSVAAKKDVLSISDEAKDFQTALKALRDVPDIRDEKVRDILRNLESGSYNVSGYDVANKIIGNVFDKKA